MIDEVLAAPDDDEARLRYAAWTSDREHAEFIQLQVANVRWRRVGHRSQERLDGSARIQVLREKNWSRWGASVSPLVEGFALMRGFVEMVRLDAATFLERADAIYRAAPVLHLNLEAVRPVAAELFASPHLARIQSLSLLREGLGDDEIELLARSPHTQNLRWLELSHNAVGLRGLEALAAHLPRLGYVGFSANPVPDPTPRFADEYDRPSEVAEAFQAKYGPRDWLWPRVAYVWPPDRDAVPG